jgi:hypothetical protein
MRHEGESRQCACGAVHRADDKGQCLGCGRKAPVNIKFDMGLIVGVAVAIALVGLILWGTSTSSDNSSPSSGGYSTLSESSQRKLFYDLVSTHKSRLPSVESSGKRSGSQVLQHPHE